MSKWTNRQFTAIHRVKTKRKAAPIAEGGCSFILLSLACCQVLAWLLAPDFTDQFGGLRQTVSFHNLLIGGIGWQWAMLFFDKIEIFLIGFGHCELSFGYRLNEVSRPVFALAPDAGPVGADRWLWLARDARSLDPLNMAAMFAASTPSP